MKSSYEYQVTIFISCYKHIKIKDSSFKSMNFELYIVVVVKQRLQALLDIELSMVMVSFLSYYKK